MPVPRTLWGGNLSPLCGELLVVLYIPFRVLLHKGAVVFWGAQKGP